MHNTEKDFEIAYPYRKEFTVAIIFSILLAIINAILPRIIQVFIDDHITPGHVTLRIIHVFCGTSFWGNLHSDDRLVF